MWGGMDVFGHADEVVLGGPFEAGVTGADGDVGVPGKQVAVHVGEDIRPFGHFKMERPGCQGLAQDFCQGFGCGCMVHAEWFGIVSGRISV